MRHPLLGLTVLLAACSSYGTVSVGVQGSGTQTQALDSQAAESAPAAGELQISRVRLLAQKLELKERCSSSVEDGPFLLDLAPRELGAARQELVRLELPSGEYTGSALTFQASKGGCRGGSHGSGRPELAELEKERASAVVEGTYQGQAFRVVGRFAARTESRQALELASGGNLDVNLALDPRSWFLDDAGKPLDPTRPENHAAIARKLCLALDQHPAETSKQGHGHHGSRGHDRHGKGGDSSHASHCQ